MNEARLRAVNATREVRLLWGAEWRRALRSGRGLALLGLYSVFSLMALLAIGFLARALQQQMTAELSESGATAEQIAQAAAQSRAPFLGFLVGGDPALVEALNHLPLTVLLVFKITLFFLPLYVALMGFDQVSGEVGPRSVRYVTIRARRSSVLLGKFLAQASVLIGMVLLVDLGIFAFAKVISSEFTWAAFGAGLARFWVAAAVYSLAYVSLTTLCSTLARTPGLSLMLNVLALFGFWLVHMVGKGYMGAEAALGLPVAEGTPVHPMSYLRFLSPLHYANGLLHPHATPFLLSVTAYVAFAALFLSAAWAVLRTRDL